MESLWHKLFVIIFLEESPVKQHLKITESRENIFHGFLLLAKKVSFYPRWSFHNSVFGFERKICKGVAVINSL